MKWARASSPLTRVTHTLLKLPQITLIAPKYHQHCTPSTLQPTVMPTRFNLLHWNFVRNSENMPEQYSPRLESWMLKLKVITFRVTLKCWKSFQKFNGIWWQCLEAEAASRSIKITKNNKINQRPRENNLHNHCQLEKKHKERKGKHFTFYFSVRVRRAINRSSLSAYNKSSDTLLASSRLPTLVTQSSPGMWSWPGLMCWHRVPDILRNLVMSNNGV